MKKYFHNILLMAIAMVLFTVPALAQDSTTISFESPDHIFGSFEALYGAIIMIGGYFTHLIPGLNQIPSNTLRVITFAILSGVAFVLFGANAIGVVLSYAAVHGIYAIILKWIVPNKGKQVILEKRE